MNLFRLAVIGLAFTAFSCSKDEDAKPKLEEQKISFLEQSEVISPPAAMVQSENEYAQMAVGWMAQANLMSSMVAYTQAPAGSTKSDTKISAPNGRSNGRTAATGDFATYVWTDANTGVSVAYQISELSDSYAFEVFLKLDNSSDWLKFLHAEEKKDRSSGHMYFYEAEGSDPSIIWLQYNWTRSGDMYTLKISDPQSSFLIEFEFNEKTKAGSVVFKDEGLTIYEMQWDSAGNGTYVWYNEGGEVIEEGEWTV